MVLSLFFHIGSMMNIEQKLLDTAQMRSTFPEWLCDLLEQAADEIIYLRPHAERYKWLHYDHGIYSMKYDDHGIGPEYDLSPNAVDEEMKKCKPD